MSAQDGKHPRSSEQAEATGGLGFGTRALRAAARSPEVHQRPGAVPIYQSVTFDSQSAAELGDILSDRQGGYSYSRLDNPTSVAMASVIAELEGAQAGYGFASGMAAIHAALLSLLRSGDHVIATHAIYGSTHQLFARVLRRLDIETSFVDVNDLEAVEQAFTPRTRVLYVETVSNPTVVVGDLPALAALAHGKSAAIVVDNTFASPYNCRPIEHGADLVVESCTKWLAGHSDVLAGVVVGDDQRIAAVRQLQIDTGASLAPFSAFLVLRGIETLHVRMERHAHNALTLARELEATAEVRRVFYPGLSSHGQFETASRLLRTAGGMLAFDLGSRAAAAAFLDALELPPRTASLGSVRTIAVHPPSTTHRQLDEAALAEAGIPAGLVRVSVGLEESEDLLRDMQRGLAAARTVLSGQAV